MARNMHLPSSINFDSSGSQCDTSETMGTIIGSAIVILAMGVCKHFHKGYDYYYLV
jgi:hypothetical protein